MRLRLLLLLIILVGMGAACGGDDGDGDNNGEEDTQNVELSPAPSTPLPTETLNIIQLTPTPVPMPTQTPTLPFPSWKYASDWALHLRYTVTNGGPDAEVDQWRYSGQAIVRVSEDGTARSIQPTRTDEDGSSAGRIFAEPTDEDCLITSLDSQGYGFSVQGQMRQGEDHIWLDIEIIPDDYLVVERTEWLCPDFLEGPQTISANFLWPMLGQIGALEYSFILDDNRSTVAYGEDLTAKTNRVFRGLLDLEVTLQR